MPYYLGGAAVYALIAGLAVVLALRLAGRPPGRSGMALVGLTLFFVFLALHPFPDPARLDCSRGGMAPQFTPFDFLADFRRVIRSGGGFSAWLGDVMVASSLMNFALCAAIGLALAGVTRRWLVALVFAPALSLGIELTQLTGLWGVYDCAWRQFDVDDLILNISGVLSGFALRRALGRRA